MTVPPIDANELVFDIVPIVTISTVGSSTGRPVMATMEGTGFLLGRGTVVTCHHCIAATLKDANYAIARKSPLSILGNVGHLLSNLRQLDEGLDLACGEATVGGSLGIGIGTRPLLEGEDVWTFGYPHTDMMRNPDGDLYFTAHPRLLKGHIVRSFVFHSHTGQKIPSYELSFPVPAGMSGAPLFKVGGMIAYGVLYGNNDTIVLDGASTYNPGSSAGQPLIERVTTFGLAHHTQSLSLLSQYQSGGVREPQSE